MEEGTSDSQAGLGPVFGVFFDLGFMAGTNRLLWSSDLERPSNKAARRALGSQYLAASKNLMLFSSMVL